MWAYLNDISDNGFTDKYGVFHYLNINLTKRLSIGFYESVIWWGSDANTVRGIDPAYLNPVIFFRPVEFAIHSPDNANIGGNASLRLGKKKLFVRTTLSGRLDGKRVAQELRLVEQQVCYAVWFSF